MGNITARCISTLLASAKSCSEQTLSRINHVNSPWCGDGNSLSLQVVGMFASKNEGKNHAA